MQSQNYSIHDLRRVYSRALLTARGGVKAGFTDKRIILKNTAWLAHCERGNVPLLEAHMIALEATRQALGEDAAK